MKKTEIVEDIVMGRKTSLTSWQKRLLPLMKWMIIGLTFFFFVASFAQYYYLQQNIERAPKLNIHESFASIPNDQESLSVSKFKASVMLEANALERRHHQANVLLMSRVWVRYLGFVTGMILALVGAVFILGKLQEPTTELAAKIQITEVTLKSSSPGIILCVLGVILMLTTIVINHTIEVKDSAIYTRDGILSTANTTESSKPQLDE